LARIAEDRIAAPANEIDFRGGGQNMVAMKLFSDVLQECHTAKKTGALFVTVAEASENLIRFYFKDGNIYSISYGQAKDKECIEILDCYDLGKVVYFEGLKAPSASPGLPSTGEIIATVRKSGKQVQVD
jgi:hypothetical protein